MALFTMKVDFVFNSTDNIMTLSHPLNLGICACLSLIPLLANLPFSLSKYYLQQSLPRDMNEILKCGDFEIAINYNKSYPVGMSGISGECKPG